MSSASQDTSRGEDLRCGRTGWRRRRRGTRPARRRARGGVSDDRQPFGRGDDPVADRDQRRQRWRTANRGRRSAASFPRSGSTGSRSSGSPRRRRRRRRPASVDSRRCTSPARSIRGSSRRAARRRCAAHAVGSVPRTCCGGVRATAAPRRPGFGAFLRSRVARVMCCRIRLSDVGDRVAARCAARPGRSAVSTAASMSAERWEKAAINASGTAGEFAGGAPVAAAAVPGVPSSGRCGG